MKMTKLIVTMTAALVAMVGQAGDSAPLLLDTVTPTTALAVDSLLVSWDAAWIGGDANATVVIKDNGYEVKRTTGTGDFTLSLADSTRHELTYTTFIGGNEQGEIYTATVFNRWKYDIKDGGAVIVGTTQKSGDVVIPSTIDDCPVTEISDGVFAGCGELASVVIPNSVVTFPVSVFDGCDKLWTAWYRTLANSSAAGGGVASVSTTIVQQVEAPYALTNSVADRAIASVTVDDDCAIDSFVLKDGKVYDSVLYISNTADHAVTLTLPSGYVYKAIKGARPLNIPANSQSILSITRVADNVFLVSREDLETIQ